MSKLERKGSQLIRIARGVSVTIVMLLVASSARAQTSVSSCGTTISASGSYVLSTNLSCSADGVDITASDVDFDLHGHRMSSTATGTTGINGCLASIIEHVTIRNGTVDGFDEDVCTGGLDLRVTGLHLGGSNADVGITIQGGTRNSSFDSNVITGIKTGILLEDASGNNIFLNQISNCGTGVEVFSGVNVAMNNSVFDNDLSSNTGQGILFQQGAAGPGATINNAVANNIVNGNGVGIEITGGGNAIVGNTAKKNSVVDLQDDSHGCTDNIWLSNTFKTASPSCIN